LVSPRYASDESSRLSWLTIVYFATISWPSNALELGARVGAVRARCDEDGDVVRVDARHSSKSALSIASRGCARVMSQTEMAIRCPRPDDFAERGTADRRAQRRDERDVRVVDGLKKLGLDDGHPFVGQIDFEPLRAVVQRDAHLLNGVESFVISMLVPQGSLMNAIAMPSAGTLVVRDDRS